MHQSAQLGTVDVAKAYCNESYVEYMFQYGYRLCDILENCTLENPIVTLMWC